MTLIDYAVIAAAIVIVTLAVGVASMAVRKLQNTAGLCSIEGESSTGSSGPQTRVEIPRPDPLQLYQLPDPGNSTALPDEAKSVLMNAVWYRCENPKCNYTQFLDVYQIVSREKGGSNALENLIVLCPECRNIAHSGEIDIDVLHSWIKGRVERFKFAIDWPYK